MLKSEVPKAKKRGVASSDDPALRKQNRYRRNKKTQYQLQLAKDLVAKYPFLLNILLFRASCLYLLPNFTGITISQKAKQIAPLLQ